MPTTLNAQRQSLTDLEMHGDFIRRHIGPSDEDTSTMLASLGCTSLDELLQRAVPNDIVSERPLEMEPPRSERAASTHLRHMRHRNQVFISMIGCGYHGTVMPPVIRRNVLENPDWYTAYTPYQAEVSQGRLEVLLGFQQMVMDLTAMDLANASLLDEATAAAEAMSMCRRLAKAKSNVYFVDHCVHPQTLAVLKTRAGFMGFEILVDDPFTELARREFFGVLLQYPASTGGLRDLTDAIATAHEKKALAVVAADILALALVKPPGEMDADIVIGNAQRFGVPMGYGGPHAAFFATRDAYKRSTPGRIIGVSRDAQGRPALRMALQTREQHIR
ncbi:MAG: hypothetical protein QF598_08805, partial [Arenicellales bacterium]|nr:hypothetical protein [Arenicellales bacterium]